MKRKILPKTDSIQKLAKFWDTHDVADFADLLEEVPEPVFRPRRRRTVLIFGLVAVPVELFPTQGTRPGMPMGIGDKLQIECFVPAEILPLPCVSACVQLAPAPEREKGYRLLVEAMKATGYRAVIRSESGRQTVLFLVRLLDNSMILERLMSPSVLRIESDRRAMQLKKGEVELAGELVKQLSLEEYDPHKCVSTSRRRATADQATTKIVRLDEWISRASIRDQHRRRQHAR